MRHLQKRIGIVLVTYRDSPEVFDPLEKALDPVALPAYRSGIGYILSVGWRREVWFNFVVPNAFTNRIAVVASIPCSGLHHVVFVQSAKSLPNRLDSTL